MVADLAPPSRRGEAMGYHGMMLNLAMASGPALGAALLKPLGFDGLFWLAAALALASLLLTGLIYEPPRPHRFSLADGKRPQLLSRAALFPALVAVCMTMPFAAILTFLPLFVQVHQLGNPGLFFVVFSVVVMASRPIAGTWSDRFGRAAIILPGMVLLAVAMITLAYSTSVAGLLSAAVLQGLGFGGVQPALMALTVDRSTDHDRSPALATLMLAFDIGHGLSAMGLGLILEQTNFTVMYLCTGGIALAGAGAVAGAMFLNRTKEVAPA
jgi:MFS family permease